MFLSRSCNPCLSSARPLRLSAPSAVKFFSPVLCLCASVVQKSFCLCIARFTFLLCSRSKFKVQSFVPFFRVFRVFRGLKHLNSSRLSPLAPLRYAVFMNRDRLTGDSTNRGLHPRLLMHEFCRGFGRVAGAFCRTAANSHSACPGTGRFSPHSRRGSCRRRAFGRSSQEPLIFIAFGRVQKKTAAASR
jgi:hypothetical protein